MSHTKDSFTYHGCGIAADRKQTRVDKAIYNRHKYAKKGWLLGLVTQLRTVV
jgi:hypothetical protein